MALRLYGQNFVTGMKYFVTAVKLRSIGHGTLPNKKLLGGSAMLSCNNSRLTLHSNNHSAILSLKINLRQPTTNSIANGRRYLFSYIAGRYALKKLRKEVMDNPQNVENRLKLMKVSIFIDIFFH
jgi:hypothetical protein